MDKQQDTRTCPTLSKIPQGIPETDPTGLSQLPQGLEQLGPSDRRIVDKKVTHSGHLVSPVSRRGEILLDKGLKEIFLINQGQKIVRTTLMLHTSW